MYSPSFDELSGGGPPDGGASSGASGGDALTQKDGAGSSGEGGGSSGASSGADGSSEAFVCPANAILCDDFERDQPTAAPSAGGLGVTERFGPVSINNTMAHSPTRSLSATVKAKQDSPWVSRQLAGAPSKITLSFWLYAPKPPPDKNLNYRIASLLWGGSCDWEFAWQLDLNAENGLRVGNNSYNENENPSCGPIAYNGHVMLPPNEIYVAKWHHIVITQDVSQVKKLSTASVDGLAPVTEEVLATKTSVPTDLNAGFGIPCVQTNSGCFEYDGTDYEVLIDDITITPVQ